ncbi:MAG TPA: acyltransferase [Mycobacteriales bacterium]|nr:acyltransferase [Mycobacteriales bacterium]
MTQTLGIQAQSDRTASRSRVVALDGLRAIAVMLVIAYHAGQIEFGWIGVPIFFVLSGHFITRILVEKNVGSRPTRALNFFRNRALRLAPLYFAACAALTLLAIGNLGPRPLRGDLPFLWTWTYNLRGLFPGYVDNPLYDHTWSLGVEVQLYLIWAALAFSLPRRWLAWVLIGLVIAGPLIRILAWLALGGYSESTRLIVTYMLPTTYLDAFAIGGCTALPEIRSRLGNPHRWLAGILALTAGGGLVGIVSALQHTGHVPGDLGYPSEFPAHDGWIWGYSVIALLAGAIVLVLLENERAARYLSSRLLVRIGVISYGIYLLHRPILRLVQQHLTHWPAPWSALAIIGTVIALVLTIAAAEASYRLFETRFMARKRGALIGARN